MFLKVFSPANAIFAGIGVFVQVSIMLIISLNCSHVEGSITPIGGQGCCGE